LASAKPSLRDMNAATTELDFASLAFDVSADVPSKKNDGGTFKTLAMC
jgi:hypothetical protein